VAGDQKREAKWGEWKKLTNNGGLETIDELAHGKKESTTP